MTLAKAPDGRINMTYQVAKETKVVKELPLRFMVVGEFGSKVETSGTGTGTKAELEPIGDRKPLEVNQSNFDRVMADVGPELYLDNIRDTYASTGEGQPVRQAPPVTLRFRRLADFHPDNLLVQLTEPQRVTVNGVPQERVQMEALAQALKLRRALMLLKGPMGSLSKFRRDMQQLIEDPETRAKLERSLLRHDAEGEGA